MNYDSQTAETWWWEINLGGKHIIAKNAVRTSEQARNRAAEKLMALFMRA